MTGKRVKFKKMKIYVLICQIVEKSDSDNSEKTLQIILSDQNEQ